MLFHDAYPNDIFNAPLRREGLAAQERGQGIAIWHGVDGFTGEEIEVLMNLSTKSGAMAMGDKLYPAHMMEKAHLLVLAFTDRTLGQMDIDIDAEVVAMNIERTGIEVFNDGHNAHLRLYDKLTKQDLLTLNGDEVHDLVAQHELNPKDYHGSAFKYVQGLGLA